MRNTEVVAQKRQSNPGLLGWVSHDCNGNFMQPLAKTDNYAEDVMYQSHTAHLRIPVGAPSRGYRAGPALLLWDMRRAYLMMVSRKL
jgi:hypothetical protein